MSGLPLMFKLLQFTHAVDRMLFTDAWDITVTEAGNGCACYVRRRVRSRFKDIIPTLPAGSSQEQYRAERAQDVRNWRRSTLEAVDEIHRQARRKLGITLVFSPTDFSSLLRQAGQFLVGASRFVLDGPQADKTENQLRDLWEAGASPRHPWIFLGVLGYSKCMCQGVQEAFAWCSSGAPRSEEMEV